MKTDNIFPAGRYYVGDLCYVNWFNDNSRWDTVCFQSLAEDGKYTIDGIDYWIHGTAFGDGEYPSNTEHTFPVDSGTIGIISAEIAELNGYSGGHIIEFTEPFSPEYENGKFYIGHITIDTDPEPIDEDDWSDYDNADEDDESENN